MVVVASEQRSRVSPRAVIILPFAGAGALTPAPSSRRPYPDAVADAVADALAGALADALADALTDTLRLACAVSCWRLWRQPCLRRTQGGSTVTNGNWGRFRRG